VAQTNLLFLMTTFVNPSVRSEIGKICTADEYLAMKNTAVARIAAEITTNHSVPEAQ
jgi:hypothetical protein